MMVCLNHRSYDKGYQRNIPLIKSRRRLTPIPNHNLRIDLKPLKCNENELRLSQPSGFIIFEHIRKSKLYC